MTNQIIPAEAVESAATHMHDEEGYFETFGDAPDFRKDHFRERAMGILEAAAPYMLADRKVMAGVLAAHQIKTGDRGMSPRCSCGWLGQVFGNDFQEDFITHQADMLDVQLRATK